MKNVTTKIINKIINLPLVTLRKAYIIIDEIYAHAVLTFGDLKTYSALMRDAVRKEVGIAVGVGVAPTKTLAKLCNRAAKKIPSLHHVCVLEREDQREWLLKKVAVGDIWGIGSRLSARLNALGIFTGWQLANADAKHLRRHFSVNLERTVEELNGISCIPLEDAPPAKKQIYCSRSFGEKLNDLVLIQQAVANYCARVTEKLRTQKHLAKTIHVFLQTSPFSENPVYRSASIQLPFPTDDSRVITQYALHGIAKLYTAGLEFQKAGVGLVEILSKDFFQADLFTGPQSSKADVLMALMDRVNSRYGRGTLTLAAEGVKNEWAMKQSFKSPSYTTSWSQLPTVKC